MTALDMIREGFDVWIEVSSGGGFEFTPVLFAILFLFDFLATGFLKAIKIPQSIVDTVPNALSVEGR